MKWFRSKSKHLDVKQAFSEEIAPYMVERGFRKANAYTFVREVNDILQVVNIGPTKSAVGAYRVTGGGMGVRLPAVEAVFRPDSKRHSVTLGMPIHLLKPPKRYESWFVENERQARALVPKLVNDLDTFGLPFFERFNTSESVRLMLESEEHQRWFICPPDYRNALFVVFEYLRNGQEAACRLGAELLAQDRARGEIHSIELKRALKQCQCPKL